MVAKSGNGWTLAPALVDLIDEVDARWPDRAKTHDGSIGDTSHAARASEHNPDRDADGMPRGLVSALDITKDSAAMAEELRKKMIADPRTWYVIHNRTIWSRSYGFKPRPYNGPNPHLAHLHISLMQTAAGAKRGAWGLAKPAPRPGRKEVDLSVVVEAARRDKSSTSGKPGPARADVELVEAALAAEGLLDKRYVDGLFGTKTVEAYAEWQTGLGYKGADANGIPGPASLKALGARYGFGVNA